MLCMYYSEFRSSEFRGLLRNSESDLRNTVIRNSVIRNSVIRNSRGIPILDGFGSTVFVDFNLAKHKG